MRDVSDADAQVLILVGMALLAIAACVWIEWSLQRKVDRKLEEQDR